ncbi:hypothetical protein C8T65DRAFT_657357 [Cerioporus squamosus]|nr:hypothetical protein C8T65DRAFT_657357 [Cerioporus squamosus]
MTSQRAYTELVSRRGYETWAPGHRSMRRVLGLDSGHSLLSAACTVHTVRPPTMDGRVASCARSSVGSRDPGPQLR